MPTIKAREKENNNSMQKNKNPCSINDEEQGFFLKPPQFLFAVLKTFPWVGFSLY